MSTRPRASVDGRPLSRRERQVIELRRDGIAFKEIAARLRIRTSTAATFYRRGVAKVCDSSPYESAHAMTSIECMTASARPSGSRLRQLRLGLGVPGTQVSKAMDVSVSRVYGIESAERVTHNAAQRYVEALRRLAAPARAALDELEVK